jgi:hypothetical protein
MPTDFRTSLDHHLIAKAQNSDRDNTFLHPSEFGDCPIKIWMKLTGIEPEEEHGPRKTMTFDNGHFLHLRHQMYAKDSGLLASDKITEAWNEDVTIAKTPLPKRMLRGESGRVYPYDPKEFVWRVETEEELTHPVPLIAGMRIPQWVEAKDIAVGDSIWLAEVPIANQEFHFGGHCDAIVKNDGRDCIVDWKGIGDDSFKYLFHDESCVADYILRWPDKHNATCFLCGATIKDAKKFTEHLVTEHSDAKIHIDQKYRIQLQMYMWLLGIDQAILWHENKNFHLTIDEFIPRDEAMIEKIKGNAVKMWRLAEEGVKPARPAKYVKRTSFPCGWCDFASRCWNS